MMVSRAGVEDAVEAHGEFDDAEVGAQVPAGAGDRGHEVVPDLLGQHLALAGVEPGQIVSVSRSVSRKVIRSHF
jgi:hypothetical protein